MGRAPWGTRQPVGMVLTLGHIQLAGAAAGPGSGAGVVPGTRGSRVAPLPRDRDKGHLSSPWRGAGLVLTLAVGLARHRDGTGAGTAPSIPPHAELGAGSGGSALIAAAQRRI